MAKVLKLRTTPPPALAKATLALGIGLIVIAVMAIVSNLDTWPPNDNDLAGAAMFTFWGVVIAELSRRSLMYGTTHLLIDLERGMLTYVDDRRECESMALVDLGELTVADHKLRAAALPNRVLFSSPLLLDVEQRRVKLERIIGEAQIRQLLSLDAPDGGAYRDDPALAFRARQLIPNLVRLREVLDALGDDPRVVAIRTAIDSSPGRDQNV